MTINQLIQAGKAHFIARQDIYKMVIFSDMVVLLLSGGNVMIAAAFHLGTMLGLGIFSVVLMPIIEKYLFKSNYSYRRD